MARDMKTIYRAGSVEEAADRLDEFERNWGGSHPSVVRRWRANWEEIIPMFGFAPEVRRLLYTTNAIESLNRGLHKAVKDPGAFPHRPGRRQAAVPSHPEHREEVEGSPYRVA